MKTASVLFFLAMPLAASQITSSCIATDNQGNPLLCNLAGSSLSGGISGLDQGQFLNLDLVNLSEGSVAAPAGSTVDFTVQSSVSDSAEVMVTGGVGSGTLVLGGVSNSICREFCGGGEFSYTSSLTSNFGLSFPEPYGDFSYQFGTGIPIPFTFNEPFSLGFSSDIEIQANPAYANQAVSWKVLQEYHLRLEAVLNSQGNIVPGAEVLDPPGNVPEPGGWVLGGLGMIGLWVRRSFVAQSGGGR